MSKQVFAVKFIQELTAQICQTVIFSMFFTWQYIFHTCAAIDSLCILSSKLKFRFLTYKHSSFALVFSLSYYQSNFYNLWVNWSTFVMRGNFKVVFVIIARQNREYFEFDTSFGYYFPLCLSHNRRSDKVRKQLRSFWLVKWFKKTSLFLRKNLARHRRKFSNQPSFVVIFRINKTLLMFKTWRLQVKLFVEIYFLRLS